MEVSWNRATPESSMHTGFSSINHPFLDTPHLWKPPYRNICGIPNKKWIPNNKPSPKSPFLWVEQGVSQLVQSILNISLDQQTSPLTAYLKTRPLFDESLWQKIAVHQQFQGHISVIMFKNEKPIYTQYHKQVVCVTIPKWVVHGIVLPTLHPLKLIIICTWWSSKYEGFTCWSMMINNTNTQKHMEFIWLKWKTYIYINKQHYTYTYTYIYIYIWHMICYITERKTPLLRSSEFLLNP